jgi:hypothetical protein
MPLEQEVVDQLKQAFREVLAENTAPVVAPPPTEERESVVQVSAVGGVALRKVSALKASLAVSGDRNLEEFTRTRIPDFFFADPMYIPGGATAAQKEAIRVNGSEVWASSIAVGLNKNRAISIGYGVTKSWGGLGPYVKGERLPSHASVIQEQKDPNTGAVNLAALTLDDIYNFVKEAADFAKVHGNQTPFLGYTYGV